MNRTQVLKTGFNVTNLSEGDSYEFRVTAENKMGVGKPSDSTQKVTAKPPYSKYIFGFMLYNDSEMVVKLIKSSLTLIC